MVNDSMGGPGVPEVIEPGPGRHIEVTPEPIDLAALDRRVADDAAGAHCLFLGTVRNHAPGRDGVTHLDYEAYPGVVVDKLADVVAEADARWDLHRVAVIHRTGPVAVGEASVGVAVSASHRDEAFLAARYLIDELKRRVPIWKKEHWDGGAEWVREDQAHH